MDKVMIGNEALKVIAMYTRKDALEDGVLVDVTEIAKEAGFSCPVAVTSGVMAMVKDIPESRSWEDESGRLWDVIYMAYVAARSCKNSSIINYELILPHMENQEIMKEGKPVYESVLELEITLKMVAGPDDDGGLCITIMQTNES